MDKGTGSKGQRIPAPSLEAEVKEAVGKGRDSFVWIREDGAVCFGDECVAIKPQESGKLLITVKPDRCGAEQGSVILDHLIRTAGKGVVLEIPSEVEETTRRPATMADLDDLKKS